MKYTECCYRESSQTNASAMVALLTERYENRGFHLLAYLVSKGKKGIS